jgi:hypothetical protein
VFGVDIPWPKLPVTPEQDTKGKAKVAGQEDEDNAPEKKRAKIGTKWTAKVALD